MIRWKDMVGFEDFYCVSEQGDILSKRTMGKLSQSKTGSGYYKVTLSVCGIQYYRMIHRLVGLAWIPNPENKRTINHIDGDKTNNNVSNLEWATYSENCQHACDTGLHIPYNSEGIRNSNSKLSEEDVRSIRELLSLNRYYDREIASMFNVTRSAISYIKHKRSWRSLK